MILYSKMVRFLLAVCAVLCLAGCGGDHSAESGMVFSDDSLGVAEPNPVVLYYSRSGTTRVIAREIADMLSCETIEISSGKNRKGLGVFTCVFDQLFDRKDSLEPLSQDVGVYDPVIIASPIWIHRLASPMRTFIQNGKLRGKTVRLFVTLNGNQDDEEDARLMDWIRGQGLKLASYCRVVTKESSPRTLKDAARQLTGCLGR